MDHLEAVIVDRDGRVMPRGERGDCKEKFSISFLILLFQVFVRGYSVMYGYWDSIEATSGVICRDRWYRTGFVFFHVFF